MLNESVWSDTVKMPEYLPLDHDTVCDALVIGGGMAGILCAYFLQNKGLDVLVVDGMRIGRGTTANTTAVITAQHDTQYNALIKNFGEQKAKQYLQANLQAVEEYRKMSAVFPCDFEEKPSYLYSTTDRNRMQIETAAVNRLGFHAEFVPDIPLPVSAVGAVKFPGMAQFHPLKFLYSVAERLRICENTLITRIKDGSAFTENFEIAARHIVVATRFPIINRVGLFPAKLYQRRSYIIALENGPLIDGTYTDEGEDGWYFRNYQNFLLVGGGDRRTGEKSNGYEKVRMMIRKTFPGFTEAYNFSAQDCISLDGVPYIGKYSRFLPNTYVASGFNEWGMTSSMVSARLIADMATGEPNPLGEVFSPQRSMMMKPLFMNLGATFSNFITPTTKRCPHLGCALKYNKVEHVWECACHGSRFEWDGELIDDPALKDANV